MKEAVSFSSCFLSSVFWWGTFLLLCSPVSILLSLKHGKKTINNCLVGFLKEIKPQQTSPSTEYLAILIAFWLLLLKLFSFLQLLHSSSTILLSHLNFAWRETGEQLEAAPFWTNWRTCEMSWGIPITCSAYIWNLCLGIRTSFLQGILYFKSMKQMHSFLIFFSSEMGWQA